MEKRWVSVEEVAQHLGAVRDTVYRWIEKRGLPAHRVGRLWKFQLSEIDEWVQTYGVDSVAGESLMARVKPETSRYVMNRPVAK